MFTQKIKSREDLLDAHEDIKNSTPLMNSDRAILKEGWLKKQSKYLGQYRKRWIVLQPNHIYSYKKKQEYKHHTEDIDLTKLKKNGLRVIEENDNEFIINILNLNGDEKIYKFIANSDHDRNEWILTIKNWLNFNRDIIEYKKKWKKIIYDRTVKKMEYEALDNMDCISLHECQCTKRIIFILNFYGIWCNKHFISKQWIGISIECIMRYEFGAYNTIQLINDFNHVLNYHYYKNKTNFINFFKSQLGICPNLKSKKCLIYLRNNRNRFKIQNNDIIRNKIYYEYIKNSDLISMQLLDSYHSFIYDHNIDDDEDKDNDDDNDNDDTINILLQNQDNTRYRKFSTIIDDNYYNKHKNNVFGDNFSYWLCDKSRTNYISPKFISLKQELLYNNIYSLSQYEWMIIREKAMKYKYCIFGKSMSANNISQWNRRTEIKSKTPISIKHIIVLLLNTNYSELSLLFKEQCQKMNKNETQFNLKKRNQIIANFCKLLFETVYLFGSVMFNDEYYYHYLNRKLLFNSFKLNFKAPISVTTSSNKNIIEIINKKGCILELQSFTDATMPYFDVNWLTDYIQEDEKLLFRIHLNINNIIIITNINNTQLFMHSFKLFIAMSDGVFFTHSHDLINIQTQKQLIKMLENINNNNNNKENKQENEENDEYLQNLFNYYVGHKMEYWLNENELEKLDKKLYKLFMEYLNENININKMQLFQWHIDINNNNDKKKIIGPTLLYTLNILNNNNNNNYNNDSFQIAFDSLLTINDINNYCSIYFGLASMPINLKRITTSFYLYFNENNFCAQIENNKMSVYNIENGEKTIGQRCFNIDHQLKNIKIDIAIKVTNFC